MGKSKDTNTIITKQDYTPEERRMLRLERLRIKKEEKSRESAHKKVQKEIDDLNNRLKRAKSKLGITDAISSFSDLTTDRKIYYDLLEAYKGVDGRKKLKTMMESDKDFAVLVKELIKMELSAKEKPNGGNDNQGYFVVIRGLEDETALKEVMGSRLESSITNEKVDISVPVEEVEEVKEIKNIPTAISKVDIDVYNKSMDMFNVDNIVEQAKEIKDHIDNGE